MAVSILVGLALLLAGFVGFVSTCPGEFRFERNGMIHAPASAIFPYISDFKLGSRWNPYDQRDPKIDRKFSGPDGQVGSVMEFNGNRDAGAGRLEILKVVPNESVEIRLLMTRPMASDNRILYRLTPEGAGTRFSWSMSGPVGFVGKVFNLLIDCDKMLAKDFEAGVQNLKNLIESEKGAAK